MMKTAVEINNLTKIYEKPGAWRPWTKTKPITAVKDVTLSIQSGELFGLLGPNGAGKTTLVKMLCTLILPSRGSAIVNGYDLTKEQAIRAATGLVVSDERSFFWRLTLQRNLDFFAALYGLQGKKSQNRIQTVLKDVDLLDRAEQNFSDLSSGMRQRLAIARALLHEPKILFLDEPTRSLDPIATKQMHNLILRLMEQKKMTVFLITHDLAEAESLCSRVALMHKAEIKMIGQPEELRHDLNPRREYKISCNLPKSITLNQLQKHIPSLNYEPVSDASRQGEIRFQANENGKELRAVLDFLRQNDIHIERIDSAPPTLEEVFAHYTSETNDE